MKSADSIVWTLKESLLFDGLRDESFLSVANHGKSESLSRGDLLNWPHDPAGMVFLLTSGMLEIQHFSAQGKKIIMGHLSAGDLWGVHEEFTTGGQPCQIQCRESARLISFPKSYFEKMLERRPTVAVRINRWLGMRQRQIQMRLVNLLFKSNREKLASLLLELADQHGQRDEGSVRIALDLTHEELGAMIGLTREQVTRLLGDFCCEEWITSQRKKLEILDLSALLEVSGSDEASYPELFP